MNPAGLAKLPDELCRTFLGWRLREDFDALVALGEGALRIDLRSGEAWCDGDPLPPLFIAGELRGALVRACERAGGSVDDVEHATLEVLFSSRPTWRRGEERQALALTCRAVLRAGGIEHHAEANNAAPE